MSRPIFKQFCVTLLLLCVIDVAYALPSGDGVLNDVTVRFMKASSKWGDAITGYAKWLFWVLALLSMVWTFGIMALRKADFGEVIAEFVRFTITTGFFFWLLENGPTMAIAIINSMQEIGAVASKGEVGLGSLTPSTPISIGLDIVKKAFDATSWTTPINNLAVVIVSAAILLCMAVVAANILLALVTAWVLSYAGVFILGFGGGKWTSDLAIGYFKAMLGIGLELMTMTLLVGIAVSVTDGFYRDLDGSSLYELLIVMSVCMVLALLIGKLPARVASLAGGGSGMGIGPGSLISAAAMTGAAIASAGAAVAAGAAGLAGGAQAISAAFSKANAAGSSDGATGNGISTLGSSGAGSASGNDPGGSGGGGAGGSPLASAMGDFDTNSQATPGLSESSGLDSSADSAGTGSHNQGSAKQFSAASKAKDAAKLAGKVALGTMGNLAQGSWDVAKEKISDRLANTTGGKIAAGIKASSISTEGSGDSPSFNDNSLSAGSNKADTAAEIAAFRDRKSATS